ncbi:MAG: hypothetical protein V8S82_01320 [Eubacteriales bacterium]
MAVSGIPVYGSGGTSGVIVMQLYGAKIVNFAVTKSEKEEEEKENTETEADTASENNEASA